MFKKPRIIFRKKIPTGTIASEKLDYIGVSFLQDYNWLDLKTEEIHVLSKRYVRYVVMWLILPRWLHLYQKLLHVKSARKG